MNARKFMFLAVVGFLVSLLVASVPYAAYLFLGETAMWVLIYLLTLSPVFSIIGAVFMDAVKAKD